MQTYHIPVKSNLTFGRGKPHDATSVIDVLLQVTDRHGVRSDAHALSTPPEKAFLWRKPTKTARKDVSLSTTPKQSSTLELTPAARSARRHSTTLLDTHPLDATQLSCKTPGTQARRRLRERRITAEEAADSAAEDHDHDHMQLPPPRKQAMVDSEHGGLLPLVTGTESDWTGGCYLYPSSSFIADPLGVALTVGESVCDGASSLCGDGTDANDYLGIFGGLDESHLLVDDSVFSGEGGSQS